MIFTNYKFDMIFIGSTARESISINEDEVFDSLEAHVMGVSKHYSVFDRHVVIEYNDR